MNILIIVAGTNEPSNSNYLAGIFAEELSSAGAQTSKLRLKDLRIDHFTLDHYKPECSMEEDFCKVQDAIGRADALVFATPIWNFGVPAHLKNLIDRMGSFALDETHSRGMLNGKPFYFIFTGGAPDPAWKGLMRKTTSFTIEALRYFGATPSGTFFEGKATQGRGKFGLVVHERTERLELLRKEARRFSDIAKTYAETGKPPTVEHYKGRIMKIGERMLKKVTGA